MGLAASARRLRDSSVLLPDSSLVRGSIRSTLDDLGGRPVDSTGCPAAISIHFAETARAVSQTEAARDNSVSHLAALAGGSAPWARNRCRKRTAQYISTLAGRHRPGSDSDVAPDGATDVEWDTFLQRFRSSGAGASASSHRRLPLYGITIHVLRDAGGCNPVGVDDVFLFRFPRVAHASQPWAK